MMITYSASQVNIQAKRQEIKDRILALKKPPKKARFWEEQLFSDGNIVGRVDFNKKLPANYSGTCWIENFAQ